MRPARRWLPFFILAFTMFSGTAYAGTPVAGQARVAIATAAHDADFSQTASRRSVVILQEWERAKMLALKAANPHITVLMYKNFGFMTARNQWGWAGTGVTTQDAGAHPDWFLKNTGGQNVVPWNYDYLVAADIGVRSYQDKWADNVLARLDGWDGVFMDDTNPTMRYHYAVERVARYPTDAAYSAAVGSALSVIGPRLRAAGKLVIPNFGSWGAYRGTVDSWLPYVSGGMEEMFGKWGDDPSTGYVTGVDWEHQLGALKKAQASGKLFVAISHSHADDAAAARYGWASVLLGARGKAAFALAADYANETWFPEYGYDLGDAVGAESGDASGVHRRAFQRGLVLVNPTNSSVAVRFGGAYSGSGLSQATGTTMRPHSGLVLTRDGAAADQPAPAPPVEVQVQVPAGAPPVQASSPVVTPAPAPAPPTPATPAQPAPIATGHHKPRSVRVRVRCRSRARTCRARVVVQIRGGRTAAVGRRHVRVTARRTRVVRVRLNRRGRAALATSSRALRVVVSRARG